MIVGSWDFTRLHQCLARVRELMMIHQVREEAVKVPPEGLFKEEKMKPAISPDRPVSLRGAEYRDIKLWSQDGLLSEREESWFNSKRGPDQGNRMPDLQALREAYYRKR